MLSHGFPKLMKFFSGGEITFYDFLGMGAGISLFLAVIGEFFAPILIIVGYQTRYAAFLTAFTMGVAAFVVHAGDPFGEKETAMLYFFSFFLILLSGPGAFSIDASGTSSK
jgi:putative oxidoreductase